MYISVISLICFLSPKYAPIFSFGIPYDTRRLMFCSIKMILGTIKRIFRNGREEGEDREDVDTKQIFLRIQELFPSYQFQCYIRIVPLKSLSIHAFTASI